MLLVVCLCFILFGKYVKYLTDMSIRLYQRLSSTLRIAVVSHAKHVCLFSGMAKPRRRSMWSWLCLWICRSALAELIDGEADDGPEVAHPPNARIELMSTMAAAMRGTGKMMLRRMSGHILS